MKPAEIVTVVVAIPLIAALIASEVAASRAPAPTPAVRTAQASGLAPSPVLSDEIVIVAKRLTNKG